MSDGPTEKADGGWDPAQVRTWLESRMAAAAQEQVYADRKGRDYRDDYDKAAAEGYVCGVARRSASVEDQARFIAFLTAQLAKDDYMLAGVNDDRRFEREVRACLRKLIKKAKANEGFANLTHFQ